MALDKMEALETRVRGLVEMIHTLKRANAALEEELRGARERLLKQSELERRWEDERAGIKSRVEKVLGELDFLECMEGASCEE
ncbi:MAG: cell division protein ZapB [Nitrospirae bacterium]|nr:MAG: cell division protein ZapB [Nitrospirota bacterium]